MKEPGQFNFDVYNASGKNPGKTHDGKPVPSWENLTDDVREKWREAEEASGRLALDNIPVNQATEAQIDEAITHAKRDFAVHVRRVALTHNCAAPSQLFLQAFDKKLRELLAR